LYILHILVVFESETVARCAEGRKYGGVGEKGYGGAGFQDRREERKEESMGKVGEGLGLLGGELG
jgi:hypothetical protein